MNEIIKKETPLKVSANNLAEKKEIVNFDAESLISQAIQKGLPVDTMERLLAMRRELKAEFAKEAFDRALANFQAECPTIQKSKKVDFISKRTGNRTTYSYAPIEVIVSQVKELLKNHGFSYTVNTKANGQLVAICKITHELGHSQESEFSVPIDKDAFMNEQQKVASALTFAKRYAFCNAFGILTGDEDNDATHIEEKEQHIQTKRVIQPTPDNPVSKQIGEIKPSEKQLDLIKKLAKEKGITKEDILDAGFGKLTGGKGGTASELIDFLLKADSKLTPNGDPLPVIQQEPITEEQQKIIDGIPF